jgi:putative transposase
MRKSRFTDEQIIGVLREVAGWAKVGTVCRRHGITEQTYYRWKQKYGDLQVPDARRLKALEEENRRLKRLVAEQALNIQVLKDVAGRDW